MTLDEIRTVAELADAWQRAEIANAACQITALGWRQRMLFAFVLGVVCACGFAWLVGYHRALGHLEGHLEAERVLVSPHRALDADVRCLSRCAAAGWGSLNGFYSPRFGRCMCQDIAPHGRIHNDFEGYRILRPSDMPDGWTTP